MVGKVSGIRNRNKRARSTQSAEETVQQCITCIASSAAGHGHNHTANTVAPASTTITAAPATTAPGSASTTVTSPMASIHSHAWTPSFDFLDMPDFSLPTASSDYGFSFNDMDIDSMGGVETATTLVESSDSCSSTTSLNQLLASAEAGRNPMDPSSYQPHPLHTSQRHPLIPGLNIPDSAAGFSLGNFTDPGTLDEMQNISACAETIKALIHTLNAKSNTLDVVLSVCRDHVTRLSNLIKDDEFEHSVGCRPLVPAALNLIICLLERCIDVEEKAHQACTAGESLAIDTISSSSASSSSSSSSAPADSENTGLSSSMDSANSNLGSSHEGRQGSRRAPCVPYKFRFSPPRVNFGSIQLDDGDHMAFCSHLMRAELSRALSLLDTLRQRSASRKGKAEVTTTNVQEVWCDEFTSRLQEMLGLLCPVGRHHNRVE